jgi:hypothetical protein
MPELTSLQRKALIGDVAVLVVLTVAGFATHLTLDAFGRMVVTGVTGLGAWAAVAPFLGVYDESVITNPKGIWRVAWAAVLSAPLATFLRGAVLARDVPPVFVLVVILTNGFGLVAWRVYLGWSLARTHRSTTTSTSNPL